MSARRGAAGRGRRSGRPGCRCQICSPGGRYDDLERRTIRNVREHGWHVMLVSDDGHCDDHADHEDDPSGDAAGTGPDFAYTVGLAHRFGHPELVVSGLAPTVMHRVLDGLGQRVAGGRRLRAGDVLEDVLAGVPVVLARASPAARHEVLTWTGWFHRRVPEALTVLWPTRTGLFAWQPGAPAVLDELQPPAWRAPMEPPAGVEADPPWCFPVPPDGRVATCTHVAEAGRAILEVGRLSDVSQGEVWGLLCGAEHDDAEVTAVHLAHLVRAAPSLRALGGLGLDVMARRPDTDSAWTTWAIPPEMRNGAVSQVVKHMCKRLNP